LRVALRGLGHKIGKPREDDPDDEARFEPDGRSLTRKVYTTGFNHHLTHAAAAAYSSPFSEAVCAVMDGFWESSSTAYYRYANGTLAKLGDSRNSPGSLGVFYSLLCFACDFDPLKGEEWKVMGLAPLGRLNHKIYDVLSSWLRVQGLRLLWNVSAGKIRNDIAQLKQYSRADVARAGLLSHLHIRWQGGVEVPHTDRCALLRRCAKPVLA
jgi:predicted NodU family carbamoyl transferase